MGVATGAASLPAPLYVCMYVGM